MDDALKKVLCVTFLMGGVILSLFPFSSFYSIDLFKIKNDNGKIEKFYVINEESAKEIIKNSILYDETNDENFDLIQFLERINGDFKIEA